MKAYLAIFKSRLTVLLQYRSAALAGLSTQFFWGFLKMMILQAFYTHTTSEQPISLSQAIVFIWLGQALLHILPWNFDKEIAAQIRNGNVAYELIRPLDLYWLWFCRSMATRVVPTLMRSFPIFLFAGLFFGLSAPVSWDAGLAFCISLAIAALLSSAITTLVVMSLFWTLSGEGILRLFPHFVVLLSGLAVPLPLFPDWAQPFLNIQPLRGILDVPWRLYTGVTPVDEAFKYFGFQILWTIVFILLGKWLIHRASKRIIIQGG